MNIHNDKRWLTLDIYGGKNEQKRLTPDSGFKSMW